MAPGQNVTYTVTQRTTALRYKTVVTSVVQTQTQMQTPAPVADKHFDGAGLAVKLLAEHKNCTTAQSGVHKHYIASSSGAASPHHAQDDSVWTAEKIADQHNDDPHVADHAAVKEVSATKVVIEECDCTKGHSDTQPSHPPEHPVKLYHLEPPKVDNKTSVECSESADTPAPTPPAHPVKVYQSVSRVQNKTSVECSESPDTSVPTAPPSHPVKIYQHEPSRVQNDISVECSEPAQTPAPQVPSRPRPEPSQQVQPPESESSEDTPMDVGASQTPVPTNVVVSAGVRGQCDAKLGAMLGLATLVLAVLL
jgi:hypothetical protein